MTMIEFGEMRDNESQQREGKKIAPLLPKPPKQGKGGVSGSRIAVCWKGFFGFCGAGLAGRTCRRNSRILRRADGDCATGRSEAFREYLANVSERVKRAPAIEMERIVSGRQFRCGEKRGCGVGKTKRGKGTKWMVVVDGRGLPRGNYLHSASPAEGKLAETTP